MNCRVIASVVHDLRTVTGLCVVWTAATVAFLTGCRVPDPPVLKDKSRGVVYDTAMEAEIRGGQAPAIVTTACSRYVDTLSEPVSITGWTDSTCRWEVFVATNRGRLDPDGDSIEGEGKVIDRPHYGRAEVLLPRQKRGAEPKLAAGRKPLGLLPVSGKKTPSDDPVATAKSVSLPVSEFLEGIHEQLNRSRQQDLLVFVHGFNVSFDSAVIRTAQIALDMPFNGAVVAYCWPSQGGVFKYSTDEPINKQSVVPFVEFLTTLRSGVPAETRINIVVHSMGNRIVMEALHELAEKAGQAKRVGDTRKPFANVVLCAPDVGQADFQKWAPGVVAQAERVTLYANSSDTALIASKQLHNERRAGDAWNPETAPGIETIDCSRIDLTFMGHSYYGSNTDVLSDLFMLLKEDLPAAKRPHLTKLPTRSGGSLFEFSSSAPALLVTWHFDDLP
ncbi:MAG: alpha/beta hydrolase [Planctomycetes bacterium]|nr:alpha/beta hydrolase [Planctomycetota bacterium]